MAVVALAFFLELFYGFRWPLAESTLSLGALLAMEMGAMALLAHSRKIAGVFFLIGILAFLFVLMRLGLLKIS